MKSKWDIIVREEKEEDEEMASLPEEDEGLLENNNKVKDFKLIKIFTFKVDTQ